MAVGGGCGVAVQVGTNSVGVSAGGEGVVPLGEQAARRRNRNGKVLRITRTSQWLKILGNHQEDPWSYNQGHFKGQSRLNVPAGSSVTTQQGATGKHPKGWP